MKKTNIAAVIMLLSIFAMQVSTGFAGIILGDATGTDKCTAKETTKVDNGVIVYFTGVIVYFTGVIVYIKPADEPVETNCGIILSD
ncbi:MAG: hypothetical protein IPN69_18260 [Acidobacteria bacterium]|nr:hypothetical protein [Acidobacteriota bacterium]MBK8151476.1 hypothetical protein [Acidobacteriota bacterium]MBK8812655.1 hypothetical protein [Acidobacteriota bacterium]